MAPRPLNVSVRPGTGLCIFKTDKNVGVVIYGNRLVVPIYNSQRHSDRHAKRLNRLDHGGTFLQATKKPCSPDGVNTVIEEGATAAEFRIPEFWIAFRPPVCCCEEHKQWLADSSGVDEFTGRIVVWVEEPVFVMLVEATGALNGGDETFTFQPTTAERFFTHNVNAGFKCLDGEGYMKNGLGADVHEIGLDLADDLTDIREETNLIEVTHEAFDSVVIVAFTRPFDLFRGKILKSVIGLLKCIRIWIAQGDEFGLWNKRIAGQVGTTKDAASTDSGDANAIGGIVTNRFWGWLRDRVEGDLFFWLFLSLKGYRLAVRFGRCSWGFDRGGLFHNDGVGCLCILAFDSSLRYFL